MYSVFLVDDEPLVKRGLRKLIPWEQYGFKITAEAENGNQALDMISAENTDVVITDVKMPFMDGMELSAILKERLPGIKVIILTGFDDFPLLQQSIRNGICDYLLKPVNADLLIESLVKIRQQIESERHSYPFAHEALIIAGLQKGDSYGIYEAIDGLFEEFKKYKMPLALVLKTCERIMATVDNCLETEGTDLNAIVHTNAAFNGYYANCKNEMEIKEQMTDIIDKILDHKSGASKTLIHDIKRYIMEHLCEEITLDVIAAKFYLNPSYISQLFKNETGENYVDFLVKNRMEKAKKLLKDPNFKIQDISVMVCYNDAKYFGQIFKKHVGMLPSEFRLTIKNN